MEQKINNLNGNNNININNNINNDINDVDAYIVEDSQLKHKMEVSVSSYINECINTSRDVYDFDLSYDDKQAISEYVLQNNLPYIVVSDEPEKDINYKINLFNYLDDKYTFYHIYDTFGDFGALYVKRRRSC